MRKLIVIFLSGILIGMVIFTSIVFALGTEKEITVNYLPLKYYFNGVEKVPAGGEEGFIYNGLTYVPLRFMAESLGQPVKWEGETGSIYIGPQQRKEIKLTDVQVLFDSCVVPYENFYINAKKYSYGLVMGQKQNDIVQPCDSGMIDYHLNKNYIEFTGYFGISDANMKVDTKALVIIKGDDKELYRSPVKGVGETPEMFRVNVAGVTRLSIQMHSNDTSLLATVAEPWLVPKPVE